MKFKRYCVVACAFLVSTSAFSSEVIDFENVDPGTIVDSVFSAGGVGPIGVLGNNPDLDVLFPGVTNNAAVIFDSANPPPDADDADLGTPNETFDICPSNSPPVCPGQGLGGEIGATFPNDTAKGNILIISEAYTFVDRNNDLRIDNQDSPVTITDDADNPNEAIVFDFSSVGPVTVESITLVDVDGGESLATVEFRDGSGTILSTVLLPRTDDNGVAKNVNLGPTAGVVTMIVTLNGSGAIDDIVFTPPPRAALGDRVWEDLNVNGIQDCVDGGVDPDNPDLKDGIIGNAGDAGLECDAGIPNVPVDLLFGDCTTPQGSMAVTDSNGFYLFPGLAPGDYCVAFGGPPDEFCVTDDFDLGAPQLTEQNAGSDDDQDSDADTSTGISDPVNLVAGETDLSVDAGFYCPAKIGDRVWFDDNKNGVQDDDEKGVPGVTVQLLDCASGDLVRETTTDDTMMGMNYMFGAESGFDLHPGEYRVRFIKPDDREFTTLGEGTDETDSDCMAPNGDAMCTILGSRGINLKQDCGLITPECGIGIDKQCRVEPQPTQAFDKCDGKLQQFTLIWNDASTITGISLVDGNGRSVSTTAVSEGDKLTVVGPFDNNDVEISFNGGLYGQSVFHTSCSDDDFNSPDDCGNAAGNGKDDKSGFDNLWSLSGFVDKEGRVLDCDPDNDGDFSNECTFTPTPLNCDTAGKPKDGGSLTFIYSAGGCGASSNSQKDSSCTGSIDPDAGVTVSLSGGAAASPNFVMPGEEFMVTGISQSNTILSLSNSGGTETSEIHTSCSQPLNGGDVYGSSTLVGINGQGGTDVTYQYVVTNDGGALTGVIVTDDPLGPIAGPFDLPNNATRTFERLASITGTTTNIATASAGAACSASDSVTVTVVPPTCDVSVRFEKLEDDKIKFEVTNTSSIVATLETFVLNFPDQYGYIKEVKLDGGIYKADKSDLDVYSGVVIRNRDWTESNVSKRQLEPNETRTLEIRFKQKYDKKYSSLDYFSGKITFKEGCEADL